LKTKHGWRWELQLSVFFYFPGASMSISDLKGITFGVIAAFFYALVTLLGKKIEGLSVIQLVFWQSGIAMVLLFPYAFKTGWIPLVRLGLYLY
jgi:drug/metabolite transporter (DMT)-like permease